MDRTLRISEQTHQDLKELKHETDLSKRTLAEEAIRDLKKKKLRKRGRNAKTYLSGSAADAKPKLGR